MELRAAVVGPAHGLHGEVVLDVRTDSPGRLSPGSELRTSDPRWPTLTVASLRTQKSRVYAGFEQVRTREDAESLRGAELLVEAVTEEDAWYPHELQGLRAVTPRGEELGEVAGLQAGAAQDLLLVRRDGRTVMVPFVRQLVPVVDVEGGRVVIDAPPGLFEDEGGPAGPGTSQGPGDAR
jgi:16S rRNA processing protein RimM